jgi:hypothetical protein
MFHLEKVHVLTRTESGQSLLNLEHTTLAHGGLPANRRNIKLLWQLAACELGYEFPVLRYVLQERTA